MNAFMLGASCRLLEGELECTRGIFSGAIVEIYAVIGVAQRRLLRVLSVADYPAADAILRNFSNSLGNMAADAVGAMIVMSQVR